MVVVVVPVPQDLEVRLEGGGAATEGVVRLQASRVDADEALQAKENKQKLQQSGYRGVEF